MALFKIGAGEYEHIDENQWSNLDMEVHEHVVCSGKVSDIKAPVKHENYNSIYRYILKHNEYSNWEALVFTQNSVGGLKPNIF